MSVCSFGIKQDIFDISLLNINKHMKGDHNRDMFQVITN